MNDSVLASGPLTITGQVVTQTNANVQQSREALEESQDEAVVADGSEINSRASQVKQVGDSEGSSLNGNGPGGGNADGGGSATPDRGNVVNTAA